MTGIDMHLIRHVLRIDEAQPLWRVFPERRALELFLTQKNTLVVPSKWEDPFEDVLSRCSLKLSDGRRVALGGLTAGFYGQCWTDKPQETDATWRIYAPGKERGVRIRVKAGPLFDTLYHSGLASPELCCFIGKVNYSTEHDIRLWLTRVAVSDDLLDPSNVAVAETLLIKRNEFEHESEVRLLFQDFDHRDQGVIARAFAIDANALVEEVVLDPRWSSQEAAAVSQQLKASGFKGEIHHSQLYHIPEFPDLSDETERALL
ncbi:MAG: DUF2971 domain-containing protein [Gemmatimonas sp.]